MIDLHIHTIASSDGAHGPEAIFDMARGIGLRALAFADHNSISSVSQGMAEARKTGMRFISAIEIDTLHEDHDLHVLAYGFDPLLKDFTDWVTEIELSKWDQARGRTKRLKEMGFALDWDDLMVNSGGKPPSGMNFVRVMLARAENDGDHRLDPYRAGGSRADSPYLNFYLDYLRGGGPAFVPRDGVMTGNVIRRIISLGGVPVFAHPSDTPLEFIPSLINAGLRGLEVYSSYHDGALTEKWLSVAKSHKLLITAGSDFHGLEVKPDVKLGGIAGNVMELFDRLAESLPHKRGLVL